MTQQQTESESGDHSVRPEEQVRAAEGLEEAILLCFDAGMATMEIRAVFVHAIGNWYLLDEAH